MNLLSSATAKILITDDNPVNLTLLNKILSSEYPYLEHAQDGDQCLNAVKAEHFDLLLLDMNMPNVSGMDVLREIHKLPGNYKPRVLVVSADHSPETVADAFRLGADDYLKTPYSKEELLARVNTQLALRSRSQYLEELVARRTQELTQANQRLRDTHSQLMQAEKMASLGQLAAGVAHEINNPVAYVYSNLQTLQIYCSDIGSFVEKYKQTVALDANDINGNVNIDGAANKPDIQFLLSDAADLLNESLDGLKKVKQIAEDLKTFSHPEKKVWQETDINECIESALNIVANQIKQKARINKKFQELPKVECIAPQINQVIVNLLVNALHAIEDFGEIEIVTKKIDSDTICISITDSGVGIEEKHMAKIFDPFFTTKDVGKGTGLGLSVSYGIVHSHNGNISVSSEVGKGTTFTVTLPILKSTNTEPFV